MKNQSRRIQAVLESYVGDNVEQLPPTAEDKKRVRRGYWGSEANVELEIKRIIEQLGYFPSQGDLENLGESGLGSAIKRYGGYVYFRQRLGFELVQQSPGYWKNFENVKREYLATAESLGHAPNTRELYKMGKRSVVNGMIKHHGGISRVRKMLGFDGRNPQGYWNDFRNLRRELEEIIKELGHFPEKKELEEKGRKYVMSGINKHGGINAVRKRLGYGQKMIRLTRRATLRQARKLVDELGFLPPERKLRGMGYQIFARAVYTHFGFQELRKILGLEQFYSKKGQWQNKDYFLRQARKIMRKHNLRKLPKTNELREMGYSGFLAAANYYGGMNAVRRELGQDEILGRWKNRDYVLRQTRKFLKKHKLKKLPSSGKLDGMGYSSLAAGIQRYHGFTVIRKVLGEKNHHVQRGQWKDTNVALEEAVRIMDQYKLDEFPSVTFLLQKGLISFYAGVQRYQGGIRVFRDVVEKYRTGKSKPEQLEGVLEAYTGGGKR
jgi:hypothetical protein